MARVFPVAAKLAKNTAKDRKGLGPFVNVQPYVHILYITQNSEGLSM